MKMSPMTKAQQKQDAFFKSLSATERIRLMGEFSVFIKNLGTLRHRIGRL